MLLLPALSVLLSFQRSTLVIASNTRPISIATATELIIIVLALLVCIAYFNMVGVIAASIAYVIGKSASNIYLAPIQLRTVRKWMSNK
jgi:hypothetical protein